MVTWWGFILRVIDCDNLDEFISHIVPSNPIYRQSGSRFVFRGHSNADWFLIPSVFREGREGLRYPKGVANKPYYRREEEFLDLMSFMEAFNGSGGYVDSNDLLLSTLRRDHSLGRQEKHAQGEALWPSKEYIPMMALAQHYGLPTRLLDFTFNPYVAAYFAVVGCVFDKMDFDRLCVFAFDVGVMCEAMPKFYSEQDFYQIKPYQLDSDFYMPVIAPYHFNSNMKMQSGLFMMYVDAHGKYDEFTPLKFDEWVVRNNLCSSPTWGGDAFLKITLPISFSLKLLEFLHINFIHGAKIFEGAEGAVKYAMERRIIEGYARAR